MVSGLELCNPSPAAWTTFKGKKLKIFDSSIEPLQKQTAFGEVISINNEGFAVASDGGAISVKKVQPFESGKMKSSEFISSSGLKIGDRLGE